MKHMRAWYLVATKPKQEIVAIKNLKNQHYSSFCPIVTINSKPVILFPGYIFIHLDKNIENWSPVCSTKGVRNFVRFGLNFALVPDNVIELIKANQVLSKEKLKNLQKFKSGDKVQVSEGVFKNCVAIFKSFKPNERVILLLNILGQQQTINIKRKSLVRL